jgi:phosphoserine phosphatase RsbU/P
VSLARAFEQELRRSRELMYAVVEATTDAVYVKDPQGHYLFINAAGARALGQTVSSVVGHTDTQLFPPAEAQLTRAHDLEVLARRETLTYEETGDAAREGRVWQSTKGVLLHPDGRVRALFGTSRDVTERRRALQLHERLLGIIGHDLRSPLTALSLDLLQLRRRGLDPRTDSVLARLARTSRRVERLVALLLDYTQLHAGRPLQLNRHTVELRGLVEAALGEAQGTHAPRSVAVRGEPVHVALDRPRMMQVLVQLLDNALRHSPPGSPVGVEVQREPERVRVRIHNEGEPIPLERLQHLFEPQEARGSTETTVRLSLGLGLFLARATVEAHGGRLQVSSSLEEGTRVSVDLPLAPPG